MMALYLEGPIGSGKTSRLVAETGRLLLTQPSESVLVLCSNHYRQKNFIHRLLQGLQAQGSPPISQLPVYTYPGLIRNTLFNYWPLVESEISTTLKQGRCTIRPELTGLEDTELLLKWILAQWRQSDPAVFQDFPGSDASLLKQLVRRIRLRSENRLNRQEMRDRSALMEEICQRETAEMAIRFDKVSYLTRFLDFNKQLDVFHRLIDTQPMVQDWMQGIRHLVVDDVDETIAAQQSLIKLMAPNLDTLILAADIDGGSRRGYLNAYPYDWQALKGLKPGETVQLVREDMAYQAGTTLLANWKRESQFEPLPPIVSVNDSFITRLEMLEHVVDDVLGMIKQGSSAGDICLVLPKTDTLSFYQLKSRLNQRGIPVQLLSGTQRPSDNPKCRGFLYLLQWANVAAWQVPLSLWEIKTVLLQILGLRYLPPETLEVLAERLREQYSPTAPHDTGSDEAPSKHASQDVSEVPPLGISVAALMLPDIATDRLQALEQWLIQASGLAFSDQLYSAFQTLMAPFATEKDEFSDLNRMIESYFRQQQLYETLQQSGQLSFALSFERWWLSQAKTGAVADTPDSPREVDPEAVVIGTPQKMIDYELSRPVQCWLDVSSREWCRSDNAPLYNAWVHSAVWDGSNTAFTEEFNESVIRTRAGHITRTLMLLAKKEVRAYASELDELGFTHSGLMKSRFIPETGPTDLGRLERATLRTDQAPILAYQSGTMAITAVPGAGKTFVNVELILELIQRSMEPQNILVLTYMDSAAKTMLGRVKKKLSGVTQNLPVISTIHSLAFRILTENDHAILLGWQPDGMIILDDTGQADALSQVASQTLPESVKSLPKWQNAIGRTINHAKSLSISVAMLKDQVRRQPNNFRLREFLPAYELYEQQLKTNGWLDFTDLIVKAVELLERYPDIRAKYQSQFKIIIEDEAQDSSRLLQRFIHLLGGEQPNLIRTGDTNQSITTTFSSADTSVFRDFIQTADIVVPMENSGRCAPEVMTLANRWIEEASKVPVLAQAFKPAIMQPVAGQNPSLLYPLEAMTFELQGEEEQWLADRILAIRKEQPLATVAVLARNNSHVTRLTGLLHQEGIPAVSLSDNLNATPVFKVLLAYLQLLLAPADVSIQKRCYEAFQEARLVFHDEQRKQWVEAGPLFIQQNSDASWMADEFLRQWYYDWLDFSHQAAGGNISTLIWRMTERLFESVSDRSNGYLCALMAQELLSTHQDIIHLSPLEIVIHQFEAYRQGMQKAGRARKSFSDILLQQPHQVVQVMTLHKSKGQEFDVVFMPGLQADYFPHDPQKVTFDESDKLIQELDRIRLGGTGYDPQEYQQAKKLEKIEEEARLIYVGLSRARRALYLTAHQQAMTLWRKMKESQPALAFQVLSDVLNEPSRKPVDDGEEMACV